MFGYLEFNDLRDSKTLKICKDRFIQTQGKSILVEYNTKCLEGFNFEQDVITNITMTILKEFEDNLSLHILIICNKNTVAILHGQKLTATDSVKEFIVKRKKNKNEVYQILDRLDRSRLKIGTRQSEKTKRPVS